MILAERSITGYHCDEVGDWVAELQCGHDQHVRHRPPFQLHGWILDAAGRAARVGTPLSCPLCDRAELPATVRNMRTIEWDESTVPSGLRRSHRLGDATWGRILVRTGRLRFHATTAPPIDVELGTGSVQAIAPGVEHHIETPGPVEFSLEFLTVERGGTATTTSEEAREELESGGDPACWAGRVCPECGGVAGDGSGHLPGCPDGALQG